MGETYSLSQKRSKKLWNFDELNAEKAYLDSATLGIMSSYAKEYGIPNFTETEIKPKISKPHRLSDETEKRTSQKKIKQSKQTTKKGKNEIFVFSDDEEPYYYGQVESRYATSKGKFDIISKENVQKRKSRKKDEEIESFVDEIDKYAKW